MLVGETRAFLHNPYPDQEESIPVESSRRGVYTAACVLIDVLKWALCLVLIILISDSIRPPAPGHQDGMLNGRLEPLHLPKGNICESLRNVGAYSSLTSLAGRRLETPSSALLQ